MGLEDCWYCRLDGDRTGQTQEEQSSLFYSPMYTLYLSSAGYWKSLMNKTRVQTVSSVFPRLTTAERLQKLSDCTTHPPLVRWAITQDRCQQLHLPIPLNRTVPTTINPSLHSHKNCLCLCPDHNTGSCISPYLLVLLLSFFCPLSISQSFHERDHHHGPLPLTQGQSPYLR